MTRTNLLAAVVVTLLGGAAHALTVDEVVAKNIEARGGAARIKAVQSFRFTGKMVIGGGDFHLEAGYGLLQKRGGMVRQEMSLQGLTSVDAFDGKEGWRVQPFQGRRDPERVSPDEARQLSHQADFDGPLVDWKQKGHTVEYLGTEDVDGTQAHKLRLTRKDGDIEYIYLDPDAWLEIRITRVVKRRGIEETSETDLGDYEQVAGIWVPFAIESGAKGQPKGMHMTIEHAEVDVAPPDSLFQYPAPGKHVMRAIVAAPNAPAPSHVAPQRAAGAKPVIDQGVVSGLGARNIGSAAMSGRIAAVAAHNDNGRTTLFVGAASGGVWKSLDGGTTFKPVFDKQPVQSIGAITIDPTNPKTIWVGTGEAWTRNSVSVGDGIYKSTDGGETWSNMGLPESERIVRILVHPKNGNVVYACVPGKLWSDSADRGVYKTTDGGKSWSQILKGGNLSTGCSGLTMDPTNPDVLFAGLWDFRRKGWTFRSGGDGPEAPSGSAMLRSADGGKTWKPLTHETVKGLPVGPWGRVEVVVAPSNNKIVYALIESKDSALYRSDDGGSSWQERDKSQMMVWRPFYFARLVVDPKKPDRVFKPDLGLVVSDDGGRSFTRAGGGSHGDWHDLWIDPDNTQHVIGGDDGGLWISYDGGNRWWKGQNLPISQFYHVTVDNQDPYQVYGGLQDNSSWVGDSSYPGGITNARWENLYNSDGFWVVVDPTDPMAVYAEGQGGYVSRVDRRTHSARDIQPKALYKEKLRFNWNTPIYASPTQKGTIYIGSQFLFRSRDRGDNWERISKDLSTNDPEKQKQEQSGGVTIDNSAAEMHTTIYSISESPKDAKVLWVGTDDGNLQLSRDAGKTWTNVVGNVPGLPKNSWVNWVEASRFAPGTAYVAFDRHTFGDMTPWVYRTTDYGKTFTRIVAPGSGVRGYAHVVKEDSVKPTLLFVGTEAGLWISVDDGKSWAEFKGGNFPSVAVRDLQVQARESDLVLATHGRGIWIIDDITPLRALSDETLAKPAAFLQARQVQQRMPAQGGWVEGDQAFVGDNVQGGAVITYYQRARHLIGPLKLEVFDPAGKLVDTVPASKRRGINRVAWAMTVKPPKVPRAAQVAFNASQGPRVLPGSYKVRLTDGANVVESPLKIAIDRRAPYKEADRKQQFAAVMRAHALFGEMTELTSKLDAARAAALERGRGLADQDSLKGRLFSLAQKLEDVKKKIVATKEGGAITGEERIREHLDLLYGALMSWEGKPAKYQTDRIDALKHELADVEKEYAAVVQKDLPGIDQELKKHKLEPIPTTAEADEDEEGGDFEMLAVIWNCVQSPGKCDLGALREADRR
jgi:photosystem II stability/assembly factor-like uncharacterized protein